MIPAGEIEEAVRTEFRCRRCGVCCMGEGIVDVGEAEVDRMAAQLRMPRRKFLRAYAVPLRPGRWRLVDQANDELWCVFLERGPDGLFGCRVNAAKPDQCRTFPERWRNPDSFRTCEGLRAVMAGLHARRDAGRDPDGAAGGASEDTQKNVPPSGSGD